jgi:hypothetical protein
MECLTVFVAGMLSLAPAVLPAEWPRERVIDGEIARVFFPDFETWSAGELRGRAVVSLVGSDGKDTRLGVAAFRARTSTVEGGSAVRIEDVEVIATRVPKAPSHGARIARALVDVLQGHEIDSTLIRGALEVSRIEVEHASVNVRDIPPRIVFNGEPSLLVSIDGDPVLRNVLDTDLSRVINTHALILYDRSDRTYYLYAARRWMSSHFLAGPWIGAVRSPPGLERTRSFLLREGLIDPRPLGPPLLERLPRSIAPIVFVSTVPAELVQTDGSPAFVNIPGTHLAFARNSPNDFFVDWDTQSYYLLLSGRWYTATSANGPWTFVRGDSLPSDFARIPRDHEKASILTHVAGTREAEEASIAAQIPRTKTVNVGATSLAVRFDGAPVWSKIAGTPLLWTINSEPPIIRVGGAGFYAVDRGVWFVSDSPNGPWTPATSVPEVIYTIPPSSPLYDHTYVYVYGAIEGAVLAGYTPGYLGFYFAPDGVVVIGTGYPAHGWIGSIWIPRGSHPDISALESPLEVVDAHRLP